ncbi:MAG: MATE family efflux transporter [Parvibaculaceae bacterium]|nr:MATE family efflux transporter [Parvibaculaceae bacterium]
MTNARTPGLLETGRPLWKAFVLFLGPMMLSNLLQALSGTINNIYLGQMIGVSALAAVSAFFPLLFFFISFTIGLGSGASVLIGQAYGAEEHEKVKQVAGTTLTVAIAGGALIAIFGGIFTRQLLAAIGTPADILADATAYTRIMLIAMPGLFTFLLATAMMRGVGDTTTPLLALCLSTVVGLIVTPALIRGWAGLPQMGLLSGALAAIVSFISALIFLAVHMRHYIHPLAPDRELLRHMRVDWTILKSVLRIGVPTGIQMILISLAEVVVLSLVNSYGSHATAAYGAVNQIVNYVQFPAVSIAITASIFSAQAIGAGRSNELGNIARTGLLVNLAVTGGLILLAYLFSRTIIGFFITDGPVLELAQTLLHVTLWSYILFGFAGVLAGIMRSSGTVLIPTIIAVSSILGVEVPVAYYLSAHMGIEGVWAAYPVAFSVMLGLQTVYYRYVWKNRSIKRLI